LGGIFLTDRGLNIVIADDEPIIRMDLRELLEENGYAVTGEASDGYDVLEICRNVRPDLVLMDVKMPLLDGLSAAGCIKDENLADAVILLTAYSDSEFVESARNNGVSVYLVKPVDVRTLVPNIELAVTRGQEAKRLKVEIQAAEEKLEKRKIIERAKSHLMEKSNFSEQQAFDYIRNVSKAKNISMGRVAEIILMKR